MEHAKYGLVLSAVRRVARSRRYDGLSLHGRFEPDRTDTFFFTLAIASFYFLSRSLDSIPLGTAYAIWTGIGAAGTAVLGIYAYGEAATFVRVALLFGLIGCIVGLKFVSAH